MSMFFLAALIALPAWAGGDSSDGHSHAAPAPVPVTANAPRAAAATEEFEVVAALEGRHLLVYVDRFASNEPVVKARVEVEGAGLKGLAVESAPGTYVMDMATLLPPGKHALMISIEAGDTADLLTATLETSLPAIANELERYWTKRIFWSVVALVVLVSGIRLVARHNREKAKGIQQ
jgi:hypothetical protein